MHPHNGMQNPVKQQLEQQGCLFDILTHSNICSINPSPGWIVGRSLQPIIRNENEASSLRDDSLPHSRRIDACHLRRS